MTELSLYVPAMSAFVTVRRWDGAEIGRFPAGMSIDLEPGRYVASVRLPSGRRVTDVVDVGDEPRGVVFGLDNISPDDDRDDALLRPPPDVSGRGAPDLWFLRFVSAADASLVAPPSDMRSYAPAEGGVEIWTPDVRWSRPMFAQVALMGAVPFNVAIPWEDELRLRVWRVERGIRAAVAASDLRAATTAAYLRGGHVREAADVARRFSPGFAPPGEYALLRMGRLKLGALRRVAAGIESGSPDAYVLAGETARMAGLTAPARAFYTRAARAGGPVYAEGQRLLARAAIDGTLTGPEAERALEVAAFLEPGQVTVAVPGLDPARPATTQVPVEDPSPEAGWLAFRGAEQAWGAVLA